MDSQLSWHNVVEQAQCNDDRAAKHEVAGPDFAQKCAYDGSVANYTSEHIDRRTQERRRTRNADKLVKREKHVGSVELREMRSLHEARCPRLASPTGKRHTSSNTLRTMPCRAECDLKSTLENEERLVGVWMQVPEVWLGHHADTTWYCAYQTSTATP